MIFRFFRPRPERLLAQKKKKLAPAAASLAANLVVAIRKRAQEGRDIYDRPMPPYSPSYAAYRRSKGRQSERRDLTFTGRMLGDLHVLSVQPNAKGYEIRIGFASGRGRELAAKHQRIARWFGLSPRDRSTVLKSFLRASKA